MVIKNLYQKENFVRRGFVKVEERVVSGRSEAPQRVPVYTIGRCLQNGSEAPLAVYVRKLSSKARERKERNRGEKGGGGG